MPYQKQVKRILAGSLNLRSRGTEIPDNDAQKLINLAYDQDGGLRSRRGHELICTAGGRVSQMLRALDNRWQATLDAFIVGFEKYVWKMGAGTAYKACSPIITHSGPRKSNGTTDWRWIPEAPTQKPTTSTAEEVVTSVDDFTAGWMLDIDDEETEPTFDEEKGMLIQGSDGQVVSATKSVELNLYDGYDKDDVFK